MTEPTTTEMREWFNAASPRIKIKYRWVDILLNRLAEVEERYSWAIQLCDDNNMPPWKERYEAEIDKAIKEDHEFWQEDQRMQNA